MSLFLFSQFLLLSFGPLGSFNDSTKVAATVRDYITEQGFSGTILVAKNGRSIYHQSFGLAYYATPDTICNNYHYSIASVTKLFTTIRVLQLAEEGLLALDASVVDYLPEFRSGISERVSLHHLLLHQSGLPKEKDQVYRHQMNPKTLINQTLRQQKAGTFGRFNYNNIDYMLLGLVIEAATGQSWQDQISKFILQPLGLKNTGFLEYGYYPRNFAYTYSKKGQKLRQDPLFYIENFYAAGNMYSTSIDLLRLDQALYTTELLNKESQDLLARSYPENNYAGYSVWNYKYPFVDAKPTVMERRGGILGANLVLLRLPDQQYTIIVLSNDDRFNPDSFGDENNLRERILRSLF